MNSRMNEDLAWLRVQDLQREAENRRLLGAAPLSTVASTFRRVIVRFIANSRSRRSAHPAVRPALETRHHA